MTTCFTTTTVGVRYMINFQHGRSLLSSESDIFPLQWMSHHLSQFALGLPFSVTLLGILLTHELGHYLACRHYQVRATLPYLIPAPSLSGTAGAVIRLKSRVKSRSSLIVIGALGPIAGFVLAASTSILGLALSKPVHVEPDSLLHLQMPLLVRGFLKISTLWHGHGSTPLLFHPVFVASWIGLLITSINLIPAGQLDGGHILYALSPKAQKWVTYAMIVTLTLLGLAFWIGWLIWAGLLLLPGMRHPAVPDTTQPTPGLLLLVPVSLAIFILCITPEPFARAGLLDVLRNLRH